MKFYVLGAIFAVIILEPALPGALFSQDANAKLQIPSVKEIANRYRKFDLDSDKTYEINRLNVMKFSGVDETPLHPRDELVLVLVEDRILKKVPRSKFDAMDLNKRLQTYKTDLENENYATRFIECEIYSGKNHQDGLTLLALRRFLKDVDKAWNLKGVVLVGAFPEATIVRRWIWNRQNWDVTIAGREYKGPNQREFLRIVPEPVAPRADIVLADLDGNWDRIYVKNRLELDSIEALPPTGSPVIPPDGAIFASNQFNDNKIAFEDFFWIQEDNFERLESGKENLKLKINSSRLRNPEISPDDAGFSNPLSQPEILVSRINARQVAVMPDPKFQDSFGKHFLDRDGRPQPITLPTKIVPKNALKKDPAFERKLLIEYFDRNHAFRTGNDKSQYRTAAVSYGRGLISAKNFNEYLGLASSDFQPAVGINDASLLDYVHFLKTPAALKGFSAHSNQWNSHYGNNYDKKNLEKLVGGRPWRWNEEKIASGFRYSPSLVQQAGAADSYIHRTIYENGILKNAGASLYIHIGCEVNTPANALRVPYNHKDYGSSNGFQNAESILFFLNGVALASRSKVFYDKPRGFTREMGKDPNNRFGDGWRAYFEIESNDPNLAKKVASNKRTYPWSIIGDWTLQLKK